MTHALNLFATAVWVISALISALVPYLPFGGLVRCDLTVCATDSTTAWDSSGDPTLTSMVDRLGGLGGGATSTIGRAKQ